MLKDVRITDRYRETGITENHRAFPDDHKLKIFGGDTETVDGKPYTLQLCGPDYRGRPQEFFAYVDEKNIFEKMMGWSLSQTVKGDVNLFWFHNLAFDLTVLFHDQINLIYEQYNDIEFDLQTGVGNFSVNMIYGKVNSANIWQDFGGYLCPQCGPDKPVPKDATSFSGHKRVCTRHRNSEPQVRRNLGAKITLLDSRAFCPPGARSLKAALKIYGVEETKFETPKGLGEVKLKSKEFEEYAINDARIERRLGLEIVKIWKQYDVTKSVSLPQMAARIFRHHFFHKGERIQFPKEAIRLASELSYHAGKNGMYVPKGVYENVYEYDINSAFPKAMRELPQLVKGKYERVRDYVADVVGIYKISGVCHGAKYPGIFHHDFRPVRSGPFDDLWVTGFELECIKANRLYSYRIEKGWIWKPDNRYKHSPLRGFVDHFYNLKNTTPKGPKRETYKNILNSLYGKFAACVEKRKSVSTGLGDISVNDPTDPVKFFEAGSLYHPFLASQITGYVRRELYNLEVKSNAIHAATDSIKTTQKMRTSDELGGLKEEVYGRCYLFRNKLYLHFARDISRCGHDINTGWINDRRSSEKISIFDTQPTDEGQRQHLCKYGLHGYKGSVKELFDRRWELLESSHMDYSYDHMVQLREGTRRGETISTMTRRQERLQLL